MQTHKTYNVEEAKRKLENYCAYQERCHKEVEEKLYRMGMIPLAIDTIIVHLIEHNFLSEERFAKSFARGKFSVKKWGKIRIERELKMRDISRYNIQKALQEINEADYNKVFHELADKKAKSITETNVHKARKKLADYLLYRGWDSSWVYEKVFDCFP